MFLDSEEDHHDAKNFAVTVTETGKGRSNKASNDDLASHFKGKTVRVTGMVIEKDSQPQLEVDNPRQVPARTTRFLSPRTNGGHEPLPRLRQPPRQQ